MASSDFNETEEFDEYNPHPYQGGYDIALTYGRPLPPSSATCYPISGTSSGDLASSPAIDSPAPSSSDGVSGGLASSPVVDAPACSSDDGVSVLGKQDLGYPWYNYPQPPELFGCRVSYGWSEDGEEKGFWRPWKRAADYLFGYSQGYGERRIGVDSYGIPIYANKRHGGEQAMSVQVPSASDQRVAFYEVHRDQIERDWSWDANYHDEQCYSSYHGNVKSHFDGNPIYAYEKHHSELPLSVELKPVEDSWLENVDYHQVHEEQWSSETQLHASSYRGWGDENYVSENLQYFYDKHYDEQPVYGELEPYQPTWARYPTYFKVDEEKVLQESNKCSPSYQGNNKRDFYGNTIYAYEKHYHEQPLNIELKPVEYSWLENVEHYEVHEEHLSPEVHWHSSSDAWGEENHGSQNLNYFCERHYDEQPVYDELEPYQPTQSRYLSHFVAFSKEVPQEFNKHHFWVSICL